MPRLLTLGIAVALLSSWTFASDAPQDFRAFSPDADVMVASSGASGVVHPQGRYQLALEASGVVAEVLVSDGAWVDAGSVLLQLEQDIQAKELARLELVWRDRSALASAQARLDFVNERLAIAQDLLASLGSISADEVRNLELQQRTLGAEIDQLEVQKNREQLDFEVGQARLQQRTLVAPVSGFVRVVTVKPGEWVQAGDPVVELIDSAENYVRVNVRPSQLDGLTLNMPVMVSAEGQQFPGQISFISPVADPASGRVEVRVRFANPEYRLRPGVRAQVDLFE